MSNKHVNRLRVLRAERNISQMDAADAVAMSANRFWRIENGYTEPTDDEKEALARFFGVRVRDIFTSGRAA